MQQIYFLALAEYYQSNINHYIPTLTILNLPSTYFGYMLCLLALYFARITATHTRFSYILVILFFEYFCILHSLLNLYIPTLLSSYTEIIYPCLPEQLFLPRHCLISASLFVLSSTLITYPSLIVHDPFSS